MNRYECGGAYTLDGVDGNAYAIMGYVIRAMKDTLRQAKAEGDEHAEEMWGAEAQKKYQEEAMSSNYDVLVSVSIDKLDEINDYLGLGFDEEDDYDEDDDYEDFSY